uniref:p23 n=1 Tax=Lettuce chlorosis virus TaxID=642478 RepID=A0A5C1IZF3_9CLOS|nr:p23 [Lettuce chlorosis virus]
MSSYGVPCECTTLGGDGKFQLHKNVMKLIRKIINVVNNLKTGQEFKNFCCIDTCSRLLATSKVEGVIDTDLLMIGIEATKGYTESKVLVEKCFKPVHKAISIREDLSLLHVFFSTYMEILMYGTFRPRRGPNTIPFMFPDSDMIFIFHNDLLLLYDKDYDEDLRREGNNYLRSGVIKIRSEPFRSDLFTSLNWLIFT